MRVTWDDYRPYSQGVSQGILYPENSPGVAWNGLTSVTEKGDDSSSSLYLDGQKFLNQAGTAPFTGTISAFTYPDEFEPCIGVQSPITTQPRETFGFCYRSNREIHLVYNALAALTSSQFSSLDSQGNVTEFSWDFTTQPEKIPGGKPGSHLIIATEYASAGAISDLEDALYGSDLNDPYLPDPEDVIAIFESNATVRITDNGDGTWTATGPDSVVTLLDGGGWSYSAAGNSYTAAYFIVTTAQSANIDVGDHFRIWHSGVLKESTLFQVISKSDPFAGYVNIFFEPNAATGVTNTDTLSQADNEFDINWPSAVFIDADSYTIRSL